MGAMFFLIGILIAIGGVGILAWYARKEAKKHGTGVGEELAGICRSAIETASQKEIRKEKALAMLAERQLSNSEIRKALGVSSRTAVRYMDELERQGKVEQVGKIGHTVTYRLK